MILRIVGDSFASTEMGGYGKDRTWFSQLGEMLGAEVMNNSMIGAPQDFSWYSLHDWAPFVSPDDYLVIILTHPARFWFVEDDPTMGKADHLREFAFKYGQGVADAAGLYVTYLQRPKLDTVFLENRLGWLAYNAHYRGWRRPLVIKAFPQTMPMAEEYPILNLSKGDLTEVSSREIIGRDFNKWCKGYDIRFNHLCMRNHTVLTDKIYHSLTTDTQLDLTTGFHEDFLDETVFKNEKFLEAECSLEAVDRRKREMKATSLGLFNFLKN